MQKVKQHIEDEEKKGRKLTEYQAINELVDRGPHPRSGNMAEDVIAMLPAWEQQAIKDAKKKRARRAERNKKNLAKQKPSETK